MPLLPVEGLAGSLGPCQSLEQDGSGQPPRSAPCSSSCCTARRGGCQRLSSSPSLATQMAAPSALQAGKLRERGLLRARAIFPVNRSCCSCNTSCSHTCSHVLFGAYVMGWRGSSEGPTPPRGTGAVWGWQNELDFSSPTGLFISNSPRLAELCQSQHATASPAGCEHSSQRGVLRGAQDI